MDKLHYDIIKIIQKRLFNKEVLLDDVDLHTCLKLAHDHYLDCIIYEGLESLGYDLSNYKKNYNTLKTKGIVQDAELQSICEALCENEIRYIPLKGSIIKSFYPECYTRQMSDLDILIDEDNLKKVKKIMESLGYNQESNHGNHDVYFKVPFMNIEFHRNLIDQNYSLSHFFVNPFKRAICIDTYRYKFTDEDFYIFMTAHNAKHFKNGGHGLRTIVDEYLYIINHQNMNYDYINNRLKEMHLSTYEKRIRELSNKIMTDQELNDDETILIDYIFSGSTYGTIENKVASDTLVVDGDIKKTKYVFNRLFPSYKQMKKIFPVLEKMPILLPLLYIVRMFRGLLNHKHVRNELQAVEKLDYQKIEKINKINEIVDLED